MKILFSTTLLFFSFIYVLGQSDSLDNVIDTTSVLSQKFNKGFYQTYQDFLKNTPSFTRDFTVVKKAVAKDKTGYEIYRVKYKLSDAEEKVKQIIWGFADDSLFYVKIFGSAFHIDYWLLECSGGKYPFAYVKFDQSGGYMGIGFLMNSIVPMYDIYVIDDKGKSKIVTIKYLKKILAKEAPIY